MAAPVTHYVKSDDVHIAYQVVGDGPQDLLFVPGFVSHVEALWQVPARSAFFRRLASFSRLILFDKRGTGMSDRGSQIFTLEQRMHDVSAILDEVGSERAALFGVSEGGPMSLLYAATYPERTSALILYGTYAKHTWRLTIRVAGLTNDGTVSSKISNAIGAHHKESISRCGPRVLPTIQISLKAWLLTFGRQRAPEQPLRSRR